MRYTARILTAVLLGLGVLVGLTATSAPAQATLSSGLPAGPIGTPVISTAAYTAVSDVLVVGDSITVRSYKQLAAALPGKRLAVNAQSGRNTRLSIDALLVQMKGVPADKWPSDLFMATGTNDIFAPSVMAAQIKRLLAAVPSYVRVHWVTVYAARPATRFADHLHASQINAQIIAGCTGRCTVISWGSYIGSSAYRIRTYIDAGGVHPTPAGQVVWGKLLAAGVTAVAA